MQLFGHNSSKLLIVGMSGMGKSLLWTRFVLNADYPLRFIYDQEGEFAERLSITPARTVSELEASLDTGWVVFDPEQLYPGNADAGFAFFCEWCYELSSKLRCPKLFACDELQLLVDPQVIPWEFSALVETGRRRGIDLALATLSPNIINFRTRQQISELVTFGHDDKTAIKWLEEVGFDGEQVRALPQFEFLLRRKNPRTFQHGKISVEGPVKFFSGGPLTPPPKNPSSAHLPAGRAGEPAGSGDREAEQDANLNLRPSGPVSPVP
ncbi:MAG: hypothetical protein FD161_71 [Limisphaerales bacterium]|nr:MAG: hypothetical protein FD161_71 [Limisphaerales bacterium]KAG0510517.1 MAG: hypothetical protein E1N63_71 [Limisphaerales bacterium]TXT52790.1 MAG: hypothetical protein FD140_333 [Limisphaerales bacterium]